MFLVIMSRSVNDLCINVVMSFALYRILASTLESMKLSSWSKTFSILLISEKLATIKECFVRNFCSSFLNLFSNSFLISYFLSSSFFWRSKKPLSMFFIYWNLSLLSSSYTCSSNLEFSSFNLWALRIIFYRSSTFCFRLDAISSICISSWPLCSSNIHLTQTVIVQSLQKYSMGLS